MPASVPSASAGLAEAAGCGSEPWAPSDTAAPAEPPGSGAGQGWDARGELQGASRRCTEHR